MSVASGVVSGVNSENSESAATNTRARPTLTRTGMLCFSTRTRQAAPMATRKNGSRYAPRPKHRCSACDTIDVTTASVGTTAATNSTMPSSATTTPVMSRFVRSSKMRGSGCGAGALF